ncbi:hypothetical protein AZE42_12991 [Rhizopogon vesiculosus]|uniref:Uncharacterized protein n=1 Tax=Rhizopogon vesiculosus TaxID=180088 RepID=A0A1J8PFX1_9AGAM|nr:hypothetical protein AZE42_12991 [Rhizopogon vesiculosus]
MINDLRGSYPFNASQLWKLYMKIFVLRRLCYTHANPPHGAAPSLDYTSISPLICTLQEYDKDAANLQPIRGTRSI